MLSDIFLTRFLTDVVHLNHPETSQRRFAPTPDHFTGISGPLHWNTQLVEAVLGGCFLDELPQKLIATRPTIRLRWTSKWAKTTASR